MESVSWGKLPQYFYQERQVGLSLNAAAMFFPLSYGEKMETAWQRVYREMTELESGAIANTGENNQVGHYWLRAPHLAPDASAAQAVSRTQERVKELARAILQGSLKPPKAPRFRQFLLIGIGGSMLGAQLLAEAGAPAPSGCLRPFFLDNTDPDGMDRLFRELLPDLEATLVIVASKSGRTMETQNGLKETAALFASRDLRLAEQAVCISLEGSLLQQAALEQNWLACLPVWPWVGGRTSVTSAMGLFPAALLGIDTDAFLKGAAEMDKCTRRKKRLENPAAFLALLWHFAVKENNWQQMVVLPYRDGLSLLPLYLQQLIMESLGKQAGGERHGITVFGNKGTTDQHSYIQQLMEGPANHFVNFIEVRKDRRRAREDLGSGDCLRASLYGVRQALIKRNRPSLTITLESLEPLSLGALIALFERAVGYYASLVGINAYDQPGVEEGKRQASAILELQKRLIDFLTLNKNKPYSVEQLAALLKLKGEEEHLWNILENIVLNHPQSFIRHEEGENLLVSSYSCRHEQH
ncbi:MAG: glucose-6-phosphate isomerase [Clostridiales bacterium]|nr:glucose-6-phosphate isomerase [Clostridiales bacterium]